MHVERSFLFFLHIYVLFVLKLRRSDVTAVECTVDDRTLTYYSASIMLHYNFILITFIHPCHWKCPFAC